MQNERPNDQVEANFHSVEVVYPATASLPKRVRKCDIHRMRLGSLLLFLGLTMVATPSGFALPGETDDPDGFAYVRAGESQDSAIVAKVKSGEVFDFEEYDVSRPTEWWKVTLASGKKGYMHYSRIRFHAAMADLADRKPEDLANLCARAKGLDYYPLARAAARGKKEAMQTYFGLGCESDATDVHAQICRSVIHLLGDEKLAKFLHGQSDEYLVNVRETLEINTPNPNEPAVYLRRVFPKASRILYAAPPS